MYVLFGVVQCAGLVSNHRVQSSLVDMASPPHFFVNGYPVIVSMTLMIQLLLLATTIGLCSQIPRYLVICPNARARQEGKSGRKSASSLREFAH